MRMGYGRPHQMRGRSRDLLYDIGSMQLLVVARSHTVMRVFKIVLTAALAAFAVIAGLFIGVVAAGTGMVLSLFKRWQSRRDPARTFPLPRRSGARPDRPGDQDVIDVTATEVPADPPNR